MLLIAGILTPDRCRIQYAHKTWVEIHSNECIGEPLRYTGGHFDDCVALAHNLNVKSATPAGQNGGACRETL